MTMKKISIAVLSALSFTLCKAQLQDPAAQQQQMQQTAAAVQKNALVGKPAPPFTFMDINGKKYSLSDFKGKVVYLDIWASWCGPCKQQIPAAKELEERYKGKDVAFVAVSIDQSEEAWKKCIAALNPAGVQIHASGDNGTFAKDYGVVSIPRFYLIDKKGNIISPDAKRPSMGVDADIDAALKQ